MSEKVVYEVNCYSSYDDDGSEALDIVGFINDVDKAKKLADFSTSQLGCSRAEVYYKDEDGEEQYVYEILPLSDFVGCGGFELVTMPSGRVLPVPLCKCRLSTLPHPDFDGIPF